MAEPPPAPALPRSPPPLSQPPPLQMILADVTPPVPAATPSTLAADGRMAEPPPALPLLNLPRPAALPPLPAAPPTMPSSASSTTSAGTLAALPPPSDHVAHNPRVGNSGLDEDCYSTSLSAICARMIQSSTYTIEVKVYGNGGNWTFYWEIVDGTSTSMEDLLSCIAGTLSYSYVLPGLTDMSQWPNMEKDFILNPPILRRAPGRPKVQRHKSGAENSKSKENKGQHQCPICKAYGHRWQSCKDAAPEALDAYAEVAKQKREKKEKIHQDNYCNFTASSSRSKCNFTASSSRSK